MKLLQTTLMTFVFGAQMLMAGSAPMMRTRCNEDSLDVGPATERTEWSAKCGHITADERQFSLFDGGKGRSRPLHPLYGKEDLSEIWIAPVDRNAPCNVPGGMTVVAFCTSSCYTPEQELLFPEGFVEIKKAKDDVLTHVMTLRDNSTLESLNLIAMPVESYTEEIRPNWQDIRLFKMKSGGELKVTRNHPIVDEFGVVKTADKFKVGESLIHYLNGLDPIESIQEKSYFGKVYNLAPDTRLPTANVVVAQGYLNGSSYFQNDGVDLQNRELLRRTIPDALAH
ncbi:MAG: hypothetical protein HYZ71_06825 [Deltaproteobacteria bacterium]|nr:hypothetical protein [Deltaproteobacteria bacterium]